MAAKQPTRQDDERRKNTHDPQSGEVNTPRSPRPAINDRPITHSTVATNTITTLLDTADGSQPTAVVL